MVLKFVSWLSEQRSRNDDIGALARVPAMQTLEASPPKRGSDEHHSWAEVVVRMADARHVPMFNDAWQEFLLAKEAAHDLPE